MCICADRPGGSHEISIIILILLFFRREEQWKEAFEEMDVDGSGELTIDELYEGLRKAGCEMRKEEVARIIDSVDSSKDHRLTFNEFRELMRL